VRVPAELSALWRRPAWTFLSATALGGLLALSRISLQTLLGPNAPFITAWPGIMLAAFLGGFWPAILVTGIGLWVGHWVLETAEARPMGPGGAVVYFAFGLVFAIAGEARKRNLRRAREQAERLAALQAQMVQVARLNAMGEMAGSLAHELNQPLTAIGNYLNAAEQLLARGEAPTDRIGELVRKAGAQAIRAGQIVSRVRGRLDRGEIVTAEESASAMVQEAVDVARAGAGQDGVAVRCDFDRTADKVMADRVQVQQVVLNLVRNAAEAMAGCARRELRIASRAAEPGFLQFSVADTGPGISPEVADRLFQPFVSGKAGGMGVGLSISRSIIETHGGRMWVEANADGGATFHFTLVRAGEGNGA